METHLYDGQTHFHVRHASTLTPTLERDPPDHTPLAVPFFAFPMHMAVLDRAGTIVAANEAWQPIAGADNASSAATGRIGTNYLALCRQAFGPYREDIREFEASVRAVLDGAQPLFTAECTCDSPTGRRWFLLQVTSLPGALPGALVLHVDVTKRTPDADEWADPPERDQARDSDIKRSRPAPESAPAAAGTMSADPTGIARLRTLEALTDTALSQLALEDLMRELLDRVMAVMSVDSAAILLLEEDGETLTTRAARGPEEQLVGREQVPVGHGFAGRIAASRKPLLLDALSTFEVVTPLLREKLRSIVGVPLIVGDRLVGVVHVGSATERQFTQEDVDLLLLAADRIAPAVERAHLYTAEREARARAEEALAQAMASEAQATERAEHLQTILETITDGVAVSDQAGHIIQTNRAYRELLVLDRVPGYETSLPADRARLFQVRDAAGMPIPPEELAVSRALRGEVVGGPSTDSYVRTPDGRELETTTSAAPLRDRDGYIVGAVVVTRDISWRKRLEREREEARAKELALKETTQRLDEFLATAAHDLRSPLAVTMTAIDLAASRFERLASAVTAQNPNSNLAHWIGPIRSCLEEASQSVDRLSRMITMLFDTAQLRAGRLKLYRRPCDLAPVVRGQVEALRKANPNRMISLEMPPDDLPVRVAADVDRIEQVVTNYVTNALKYSLADQPVNVRVEVEGTMARVSVRDLGPGLPPREQERIWQRFYRVRGIHVQSGQNIGLGLGLHICKTIIERHEGHVGVTSAVGGGSTFWFTLPLRLENAKSERGGSRGSRGSKHGARHAAAEGTITGRQPS